MRNSISISQETDSIRCFRHFDEGGRSGSEKVALRAEKIRRASTISEQFRHFFP